MASIVGIVMGSSSDEEVMSGAANILQRFSVEYEWRVVSAHRTPETMLKYASGARAQGLKVIIAGAGGAAHLPGMLAAATTLPVIGVPVALARLDGLDSLLSIVQMPRGVPVATVAINGATNAGLLALRILATDDAQLAEQLEDYRVELANEVSTQNHNLRGPRPE
ncbi:MAG: 5-(carboxyamino)imidazole ribonucleotide mutase [Acidimicrobiales bacterium]